VTTWWVLSRPDGLGWQMPGWVVLGWGSAGWVRVVSAAPFRSGPSGGRAVGPGSADDDAGEGRGTGNGGDHLVVHGCTSLQSALVIRNRASERQECFKLCPTCASELPR
jgi:hypothetical protein